MILVWQPETVKTLEIWGDSLTLAGSIALALEALFKGRMVRGQRAELDAAASFHAGGMEMADRSGEPVSKTTIEDREIRFWQKLALGGVLMLVAGFAVLLAAKVFAA